MSASFGPPRVSMTMMRALGHEIPLRAARARAASIPAERNISSVRIWKKAARGKGELSLSRSTASDAMPCCARNIAAERPTSAAAGDQDRRLAGLERKSVLAAHGCSSSCHDEDAHAAGRLA